MYERPELDKDYLTEWIEAEYEVMGWMKPEEPNIPRLDWLPSPLIKPPWW